MTFQIDDEDFNLGVASLGQFLYEVVADIAIKVPDDEIKRGHPLQAISEEVARKGAYQVALDWLKERRGQGSYRLDRACVKLLWCWEAPTEKRKIYLSLAIFCDYPENYPDTLRKLRQLIQECQMQQPE